MRTGTCIVQHGLTPEAVGVVNQAVTLARRRCHAQVTPLHVANVLLSSSSPSAGLLRVACLRSHSHPLRCKALELCFNVALNRLPSAAAAAAAAPPLLSPPPPAYHHRLPSLSNALVAAFKRAQANQRRGSSAVDAAGTQPPPPLLAVRIEVEHLVVAILDDPSVSRVMREAGFCSTQVKSNVENALSPETSLIAAPNSHLINSKSIKTKPFLENVDDEALLTINPGVSLGLSLNFNSDLEGRLLIEEGLGSHQFTFEGDRSINYTSNYPARHNKNHSSLASTLPSWLQQHKEDNKRRTRVDEYDDLQSERCPLENPYRNWSSALKTQHNNPSQMMFNFSSPSPCDSSSSSSISSFSQSSLILHHGVKLNLSENPSSRSSNMQVQLEKPTTSPYVSFYPDPNSTTSSSTMETEYIPKYKELNAENLKILRGALEKKVPWQREIISKIASTVLQCRSGMMKRKGDHRKPSKPNLESSKEATWMFFQGRDTEGERRISEELASLIFSSPTNLVQISATDISSPSKDYHSRKRPRTETSDCGYLERLFEEINENPHRVFLIEDIEQADRQIQAGIKNAIERGRIRSCLGEEEEEEVSVSDAIVILSCKSFKSRSNFCRFPAERKEVDTHLSLDLNLSAPAYDLDDEDDGSFDDVGIMELVDGAFLFN